MKAKDIKPGDFIQLPNEDFLRFVGAIELFPNHSFPHDETKTQVVISVPIRIVLYFNALEDISVIRCNF